MAKHETVYCEDWGCPAWVSCKHAWGRAREYAAMDIDANYELDKFGRAPGADACADYERDEPKEWMMRL